MTGGGLEPAAVCDGGALDCGAGLLIAIRRALSTIAVGDILEIRSEADSVATDLPAWCDIVGHRLEQVTRTGTTTNYFVRKGR